MKYYKLKNEEGTGGEILQFCILEVTDLLIKDMFLKFRGRQPDLLYIPKSKLMNFIYSEDFKKARGAFMVGGCISKTDIKTYEAIEDINILGYKLTYDSSR